MLKQPIYGNFLMSIEFKSFFRLSVKTQLQDWAFLLFKDMFKNIIHNSELGPNQGC